MSRSSVSFSRTAPYGMVCFRSLRGRSVRGFSFTASMDLESSNLAMSLFYAFNECIGEHLHALGGSQRAHHADAEDLAGQGTEPSSDVDVILFEQALAGLGVIHAR